MDEALRSGETAFHLLVDAVQDYAIYMLDPQGRVASWNTGAQRIKGYSAADVIGRHFSMFYTEAERQRGHPDTVLRLAAAGGRHRERGWRVRKDGSAFWADLVINPVRDSDGRLLGFAKITRDLSKERNSLESPRHSESRFRTTFLHAPIGVAVRDTEGRFVETNPALQAMVGYDEEDLRGKRFVDLIHPDDRPTVSPLDEQVCRGEHESVQVEKRFLRKNGEVMWGRTTIASMRDETSAVRFVLAFVEDITVARRADELSEQLRQFQRIEAVGRLAGGIAHDFNNLLTAIDGHARLLEDELRAGQPVSGELAEIRRATDRAANLTRQLLAFSRKQVLQPRVLDPNAVVLDLKAMMRRVIGEDVHLVVALDPGVGALRADRGQLEQVLINLAVNSRDAMPGGGQLLIETANADVAADQARPGLLPGAYVTLCVSDTGHGIDKETLPRIFEPFFTTKEVGKGTGLGLSTVYGIVKQSGGFIDVDSEIGRGTTVRIYFPRVEGGAPASTPQVSQAAMALGGGETILIVEDEDGVRTLVRKILQKNGYKVLEARNAAEALVICGRHNGPIDLLLSDVIMPEMNGLDLARHARPLRPRMQTLFMSGYADDLLIPGGGPENEVAFIGKPFSPESLAGKIREVLDARRPGH